MTGKFSQNRRAESDQKEGGEYSGNLKHRTLFSAKENNSSSSQFFASGGQSIGISASASVLPANIQD